ncbi:MAG: NADH-quinone oxidoreductase subunit NuoH [Rhodobacteraceae bacterium]|nr:NADH-quinone oxidoreductase subunit NuoH [Paracoccaceae bacterium]
MEYVLSLLPLAIKMVIVVGILLLLPLPLTWLERKIAAHIQQRPGPMRVGWHGLLQPLADAIKLLTKEDHIPTEADRMLFAVAPVVALVPPFLVFVAIPFGDPVQLFGTTVTLSLADLNVGLLFILAVSGIGVFGTILAGWASNSKYAVLGSLRSIAQMISYEIPMGFSVIGVVMLANSMQLTQIVAAQQGLWNIVLQPIGFFVFFVAGLAEAQRIPFDLPEAEGDLGAGYHTEYSGIRFSLFMLAEYLVLVALAFLNVLLFFGGWLGGPAFLPPFLWLFFKVGLFIWVFMWLRFTFPRYRYDQLMTIGWKVLLPLSLLNILVSGFLML